MSYLYTAREVGWLLSLTEKEAYDEDSSWPDPLGQLSADVGRAIASAEPEELPVIVRWREVQEAKGRAQKALDDEVLELTQQGFSQREVAERIGRSPATVNRRLRASVDEILAELQGRAQSNGRVKQIARPITSSR